MTPKMELTEEIDGETFARIIDALYAAGFAASDINWSENAKPPTSAEDFALEAVFVICNSGMKNTVARGIYDRIRPMIESGGSALNVFGHYGKATAIDIIWIRREEFFASYMAAEDKVEFCASLPWIGPITKYHLSKNFGAQVAKPDVHLQRLADREGVTAQALCERLAEVSGYKIATVDLLLWRACAEGIIDSRTPAGRAALGEGE